MREGKGRQTFDLTLNGLSRHLFKRQQATPIADSCWPRSRAGPGIGCDTRKRVVKESRWWGLTGGGWPCYTIHSKLWWGFSIAVTPGLRASCPTSWAQPDVPFSVSLTFSGKVTSSQHELTTALCTEQGGKHHSLWTSGTPSTCRQPRPQRANLESSISLSFKCTGMSSDGGRNPIWILQM